MGKERVMLKLTEILLELHKGSTYVVAMHNYKDLELIKAAALSVMGPLWVSVDINKERYVIARDTEKEYEKDSDHWL